MKTRAVCAAIALLSANPASAADALDPSAIQKQAVALFGELPANADRAGDPAVEAKIVLGRMLFYDTRLSKSGDLSCNSCHDLARYGVDGQATSTGEAGQRGGRNSPSVYNAAFHIAQFWDGRAPDVEAQAKGPVTNPIEMAMPSEAAVDAVLRSIPGYAPLFVAAFPGDANPVSFANAAIAIGAFERRLVTPSPFDRFLAGDTAALSSDQLRGLADFMSTGCASCHMGQTVGGAMFMKLGIVHPYANDDPGRFAVTKNEADRQVFKVPSLRNVAKTHPYFHDGKIPTTEDAVKKMALLQLGKTLSDAEAASIVTFLGSLTGTIDPGYVAKPVLPPSAGAVSR